MKNNRVFDRRPARLRERAVMLYSPSMMRDFGVQRSLNDAGFTYSMWNGYLKEERCCTGDAMARGQRCPWQSIHTSGHASVERTCNDFAAALAPK